MKNKYGFDFSCLRFPMVISPYGPPRALTASASQACLTAKAVRELAYQVMAATGMSTLYSIYEFLHIFFTRCDPIKIKQTAFNLYGFHFNDGLLAI